MSLNKFYLPQLQEIEIRDYELYKCPLKVLFNSKLNIIFGTNGTGKSTLLMLILFSIIGPYRGGIKTKTRNDQRKDNRPLYDDNFFISRVLNYKDSAQITAKFIINNDYYQVTHSLNDCSLKEVLINGEKLEGRIVTYKTFEKKYSKVREKEIGENELLGYLIFNYQERIRKSTELPGGINTLISMLLDVMFLDEERKFTFWNASLQETIIGKYIVDKDFYEMYCEKKLDTKALESKYKKASETANFMAKFFEKEKNNVDSVREQSDSELRVKLVIIDNEIQSKMTELSALQQQFQRKNDSILNLLRKIEENKEIISKLEEKWYKNLFPNQYSKYYKKYSKKMVENLCPICGQNHIFDIKTENCIFCDTKLQVEEKTDLIKLDIERKNQQLLLTSQNKELEKTKKELSALKTEIEVLKNKIEKLHSEKNSIEISLNPSTDAQEQNDAKRLDKARKDRDDALKLLNVSKNEENEMKREVEEKLVNNFKEFSKVFCRYATSFFGEKHKVELSLPFVSDDSIDETMIRFLLDNKERTESYMLSESQRIFTDLAFRYSILTCFHNQSFFMCETPDSTLDLFHEENAVNTFSEYINMGNMLILSANARNSNLISKLYDSYEEKDKNVIDLTELSRLSLENKISFHDYVGGRL